MTDIAELIERHRMRDMSVGDVEPLYRHTADAIEALQAELAKYETAAIHSCHDACERPLCVARRDNAALQAKVERLEGEVETQTKRADAHWRTINDQRYMNAALVDMLGPIARKVWDGWQAKGMVRVHYSWGRDAALLTGEERAQVMLDWDDAMNNGQAEEMVDVDDHIAALQEKPHD